MDRFTLVLLCFAAASGQDHPASPPLKETKEQLKQRQNQAKTMAEAAKTLLKNGDLAAAEEKILAADELYSGAPTRNAWKDLHEEKSKKAHELLKEAQPLFAAHKHKEAAAKLEEALKYEPYNPLLLYNMAAALYLAGDRSQAQIYLDACVDTLPDRDDQRDAGMLLSHLITGERLQPSSPHNSQLIDTFNNAVLDFERDPLSLDDLPAANRRATPCEALRPIEDLAPRSPALLFNRARCAEYESDYGEASRLLSRYLTLSKDPLDREAVENRLVWIRDLEALSGAGSDRARRHFANAARHLDMRRYDLAIEEWTKAATAMPAYPGSRLQLALTYEAFGSTQRARQHFDAYLRTDADEQRKQSYRAWIDSMETKRALYESTIREAQRQAAMLTYNFQFNYFSPVQYPNISRAALSQLALAQELFPLAPEVNDLTGVLLQHLYNSKGALRSYDALWSFQQPVSFYATFRHSEDKKNAGVARVYLVRDAVHIVPLSRLDAKTVYTPTGNAAAINLGAPARDPWSVPATGTVIPARSIRKLDDTRMGSFKIELEKAEWHLHPIHLTDIPLANASTNLVGRRLSNSYMRLFERYLGVKVDYGAEGLSFREKLSLGMNIATIPFGNFVALQAFNVAADVVRIRSAFKALRPEWIQPKVFKLLPAGFREPAYREKL